MTSTTNHSTFHSYQRHSNDSASSLLTTNSQPRIISGHTVSNHARHLLYCSICQNYLFNASGHFHVNALIPNDSARSHVLMAQENTNAMENGGVGGASLHQQNEQSLNPFSASSSSVSSSQQHSDHHSSPSSTTGSLSSASSAGPTRHLFNAQYVVCALCRHEFHHDPQDWHQDHECFSTIVQSNSPQLQHDGSSAPMHNIFCDVHALRGEHVQCDFYQTFQCNSAVWENMCHNLGMSHVRDVNGYSSTVDMQRNLHVCPHRFCAIIWDHVVSLGGAGWEKPLLGRKMLHGQRFMDVDLVCLDASDSASPEQNAVSSPHSGGRLVGRKRKREMIDSTPAQDTNTIVCHPMETVSPITTATSTTTSPFAKTLTSLDRINFILDIMNLEDLSTQFKDKIFQLITSENPSNRKLGTTLLFEIVRETHHNFMSEEQYQTSFAEILVAIVNDPHTEVKHQMSVFCSLLVMFPLTPETVQHLMEPFFSTFMEYLRSVPTYYNTKDAQEDIYVTSAFSWLTLVFEYMCEEVESMVDHPDPNNRSVADSTNLGKRLLHRLCCEFIDFLELDMHSIHFSNLFIESTVLFINFGYTRHEFDRLKSLAFKFLSKDDSSLVVGTANDAESAPTFALLGFRLLTFLSTSYAQQCTRVLVEESVDMIRTAGKDSCRLKGGLVALGVISEQLSEQMTVRIEEFLELIVIGLKQKENTHVMNAACQCILQFISHLHPHIMQFDNVLVKMVCDELHQQTSLECLTSLCKVIENISESSPESLLKEHVAKEIIGILPTMENIIQGGNSAREAINVISHLSYGASKVNATLLTSYWTPQLFDTILVCARQQDNLHLRCDALKCVSVLLLNMPQERWGIVPEIIQLTHETQRMAMQKRDESTNIAFLLEVFGRLGMSVKSALVPHLTGIMLELLKYAGKSDCVTEVDSGDNDSAFVHMKLFTTRQRSAAAWSARMLFFYLKDRKEMLDYVPAWLDTVGQLLVHAFEDVRREAITLLRRLAECEIRHETVKSLGESTVVIFIERSLEHITAETDRPAVASWFDGLRSLVKKSIDTRFEKIFDEEFISVLCTYTKAALEKHLPCCIEFASNTDDPLDAPHDSIMSNSVSDFIAAAAKLPSNLFLNRFYPDIHEILVQYLNHNSTDDRTLASGTIGEVFTLIKENCAQFVTDQLIENFIQQTQHVEFFYLSRNCFFALGVIALYAPHMMKAHHCTQLLEKIASVLLNVTIEDGLRDNALACLGRLIIANRKDSTRSQDVPRQYEELFLQSIPLKEDKDEIETVYEAMGMLFEEGRWQQCKKNDKAIREAFERRDSISLALKNDGLSEKWKKRLEV
uniref:Uncharacterized protein n=1 Tax=Percolomonas cosmopolitus TaxID=63605 RepID=A0A7S1PJ20_9EUKA|mmetsp:Transcript_9224/g.34101  ORF Transcript_9224/g.34101 Transcript_9224/m.34101 type:complete len:1332 (+) Transcript_9224:1-3996(+)